MARTTGRKLSADEVFVGLVDHGLFGDNLPSCFNSEDLSNHVPNDLLRLITANSEGQLRSILKKRQHDFIRYESLRHIDIPRQMGIPHPESYIIQCLAIKRHWREIIDVCARPKRAVSRIFVQQGRGKKVLEMDYDNAEDPELQEERICNMMGKNYVAHTDISSCFPSIYTHSIPWAMHGLSRSKADRNSLLLAGNLLDRATQNMRDGQTNGLLIGPHSSNIISEIILTQVDHRVQRAQEDYEYFNRHIDDYIFYAKNLDKAENFIRELSIRLREYEGNYMVNLTNLT